jgi:uncharacterized OsmC-like protein
MTLLSVYFENDNYTIAHNKSGEKIITDTPVEYGGDSTSFSSTDLLAASLANCIFTSIDKILIREGIAKEEIFIDVDKKLHQNPKSLESISLTIKTPISLDETQTKKVMNAINICPVYKCLKDGTDIIINFEKTN